MNKSQKGSLVYIPANVRLTKEDDLGEEMYVKQYRVTEKPSHCLVVGTGKHHPVRKYKVIFEGTTWTVEAGDVYEVEENNNHEEKKNVSYIG